MVELEKPGFDAAAFLASAGLGRRIIQLAPKDAFFSQGDPADSVFYLQKGRAKVTVVSVAGKEATITLISSGEFVGEAALAAVPGLRLSTATAITPCTALKIGRDEMIRVMHEEHEFSDLFLEFLLEQRRLSECKGPCARDEPPERVNVFGHQLDVQTRSRKLLFVEFECGKPVGARNFRRCQLSRAQTTY